VASKTGPNTSPKPPKSVPVYHGGPPGKLNIPQKDKKAPHPSTQTGAGNTPAKKGS
jgi:hypothetical protein